MNETATIAGCALVLPGDIPPTDRALALDGSYAGEAAEVLASVDAARIAAADRFRAVGTLSDNRADERLDGAPSFAGEVLERLHCANIGS